MAIWLARVWKPVTTVLAKVWVLRTVALAKVVRVMKIAENATDYSINNTASQVLWINLMTDGLLGISLGVEPAERGVMQRAPRASLRRSPKWRPTMPPLSQA